ncbi:MAG TPA: response regulator transcription factor [Cytophagaceae bacterium]|jgi:DNA-binding response OmpR family regulator
MIPNAKILLVEDDECLGFLLKDNLEMAGCFVDLINDGGKALNSFTGKHFDLCILDVMLPGKHGFEVAEEIRKVNTAVPIIFLTAKSMKEDRIKGFKIGGDDYITKPFSLEELLLRVSAILKRTFKTMVDSEVNILCFGNSCLDFSNQILKIGSEEEKLTYREVKLLKLLCLNSNKLLEREFILKEVWEDEGIFVGRSLDVFISRLRRLLKSDTKVQISNIHGVGYKFQVS